MKQCPRNGAVRVLIVLMLLGGCARHDDGGSGNPQSAAGQEGDLQLFLTDAPGAFDSLWVTIEEIAVHRAGGGWTALPFLGTGIDADCDGAPEILSEPDGAVTVDLLSLRDLQVLFAGASLPAGKYTQIRWRIRSARGETGGFDTPLDVPSGVQSGLKLRARFVIRAGEVTPILLDFVADESVVFRDGSGKPPLLKPVIRLVPGFSGPAPSPLRVDGREIPMRGDRVVFVIDRSWTMGNATDPFTGRDGLPTSGTRWDRARAVVLRAIDCLPPTVEFNVVTHNCVPDSVFVEGRPATPENKRLAEEYLFLGHATHGGSGTGPSVAWALEDRAALDLVILLDEFPNCGAAGLPGHRDFMLDANLQGAAIHTYGIDNPLRVHDWLAEIASLTGGVHLTDTP